MFMLADRLGQPVYIVEKMTVTEFTEWIAYCKIMKARDGRNDK